MEGKGRKEEWRNYFRRLLDGFEEVEVSGEQEEEERARRRGDRRGGNQGGNKKNENKKGSRSGWNTDGGMKVCGGEIIEKMVELMKSIWKEGIIPQD